MDRDAIRQKCWDEALQCFGTSYIFERRANHFRRNLHLLNFLGIAVPASIGGIVLSFGNISTLQVLIAIAGVLGLVQLISSIWALTSKWDDSLTYSVKSNVVNKTLSAEYKDLASSPPINDNDFYLKFQVLETKNQLQNSDDVNQGVNEKEKRIGMRAGLREFQRKCATCNKVPDSMKPSQCATCGNF